MYIFNIFYELVQNGPPFFSKAGLRDFATPQRKKNKTPNLLFPLAGEIYIRS
jgi:hypothetical protein